MTTQSGSEPGQLREIERELARKRLRLSFTNPVLEAAYTAQHHQSARLHNRITICILVALFDAFLIPELRAMPDAVAFSAFCRFAVLTPATIILVLLDWRGVSQRWIPTLVTLLLIAPAIIAALESAITSSPLALNNHQAVPLLQLVVLTCRLSMRQAMMINGCCCLLFILTTLTAPFVPAAIAPSLVMTELAIGTGALVFAWRIDLRDRQVFLFTRQAAIGRDMLAAQNRMLERMTQADALTGLGNRRCFDETMAALWANFHAKPVTVTLVMFDIDCFKQFNDALGHQAGDECLGAVARAVTRCLRNEKDTLVRYGGEEFAIILPGTELEEGCAVAERVRMAVIDRALPHPGDGPTGVVTVSLGVATVSTQTQTSAALVEAADRCLYAAKRLGRNRVEGLRAMVAGKLRVVPAQEGLLF